MDATRIPVRICIAVVWLSASLASVGLSQKTSSKVCVASISFEPVKLDLAGNANKLERYFRKAADGGAKMAVAPEGILEGYIVNEIIGRDIEAEKMRDVAVSIDSPTIKRFQNLARELNMCLVFGFAEKIDEDVFNTAVFIDNLGHISGKYHKMQFHEGYDPAWWFNRLGKTSRAFDTPYGRCGVLICNDRWNPLLAKIPALDGAQFLVIPAYGSTGTHQDEAVLARGVENGLPVVEANVGVSLVVSENRKVALSRQREGITFGEIVIPPRRDADTVARDHTEEEFLKWRDENMPIRLAKVVQELDPRGVALDKDTATLRTSTLEVLIGNNRSLEVDGRQHFPGYNGIFLLKSTEHTPNQGQGNNLFVPAYAGINLEHYFDAKPQSEGNIFFEPRFSKMSLKRIDERTVELYQPPTPIFKVESWTRFSVGDPHYVDFSYRCVPHRDEYAGGFLGVFWASYINAPLDKSMYFIDAESTLEKPVWRQLCTQQHNHFSTVRSAQGNRRLNFEKSDTLFTNVSPLRYSVPFFYGRFRDMVLIYAFRSNAYIRFTHSPSGGGSSANGDDTNPAWDFQLIIPKPKKGKEYGLAGRLIVKKWQGRADVLNEVHQFVEPAE